MSSIINFAKKLYSKLPIILYDVLAIPVAWLLAYWLRFNLSKIPFDVIHNGILPVFILMIIQTICYYKFKVYRGVWRFVSLTDALNIIKSIIFSIVLTILLLFITANLYLIPRSVWPLYLILDTGFLCGGRFLTRWLKEGANLKSLSLNAKRTLVIGAGQAGEGLVRDIKRQVKSAYDIIGFIDDNKSFLGLEIHGVKVLGQLADLNKLCLEYNIELIFIATPSANSKQMRAIVDSCEQTKIPFRTLPSFIDIAEGKVDVNALREVRLEDLLGRDQVQLDWHKITTNIKNKKILITGGGGSIGSELCRQVANLNPAELIIIDNSEFNLYKIQLELELKYPELKLQIALVSVTDRLAVSKIIATYLPEIVFHAAAYKHVPLLEIQGSAAIINNVMGTKIVAELSAKYNVEKFILISTDKAVNPTNIMGASKRIAEIFCQNLNSRVKTNFITVRFGNVLGSTGSVVPLFKQQLLSGGPLTVTHPDITRYFMTIPEACQLILQTLVNSQGGEILVLDMGEPIKISYLAEQIIKLAGKKPHEDIEIKFTGLRPGEKLYEELFHESEQLQTTEHGKIFKARFREENWEDLNNMIEKLEYISAMRGDLELKAIIRKLVPEFSNQDIDLHEKLIVEL
jgi:FlaA1/EpsC-like NDP-sugar epimerase